MNMLSIGFAISIETPPVDWQFGNAANMFSNFLTIIANLECHVIFDSTRLSFNYNPIIIKNLLFFRENRAK
jgi:hypothetical protein